MVDEERKGRIKEASTITVKFRMSHLSMKEAFQEAQKQVSKVFLGHPDVVKLMFIALLAEGHILIDDKPGLGKTTLAKAMASVMTLSFQRIQFTADLLPSDILGTNIIAKSENGIQAGFRFHPGPIFTHVLLADEINRAPARTQSALLEAMAENQVTVDGERHPMHKPFFVIATQNPSETLGTYVLPDAQKDRFIFRTEIGYPSPEAERSLWLGEHEQRIDAILDLNDILAAQEEVKKVAVSSKLLDYLQALIQQTRTDQSVTSGLSPRAGLLWLKAAKARAWLMGRGHVMPEDLQSLMFPLAAHRIQISSGSHPDQVRAKVRAWIETTPVG